MDNINKELFDRNLIDEKQFGFLEAIRTNKIVSVYYELRMVLYLGIMLFTGGVGYFAYQNMGEIGHLLSMTLITVAIGVGSFFIKKYAKPYSNLPVTVDLVYFDYILILVASLIISLFAYIQVYFDLVELLLNWTSFISAFILITMSYRYDNRALLSMGITALAAAVGLSITPIDWVKAEWSVGSQLYVTTILLGLFLIVTGEVSYQIGIKKHFRFTYQNFGILLYYVGCMAAMFDSGTKVLFAFILFTSALYLTIYTWKKRSFLFFLYSNIAAYIAVTYLLFKWVDSMQWSYDFIVYYFPVTCVGYIVFLVTKKNHFAHE
jgi:hypothetical protein